MKKTDLIEKEHVLIFGASEHARCVIDIIEQVDEYKIIGIIDKVKEKGSLCQGYKVLGKLSDLSEVIKEYDVHKGIIAIGDNYLRSNKSKSIKNHLTDFTFVSAIHPSAIIGKNVKIGSGTVIMAGVIINNDSTVGEHCYISTKASLGHDSVLADFSSLGPGVTTGGRTTLGYCTAIGIGANILNGKTIGNHSVIGSGSLVTRDVSDFVLAYGLPAKVIRNREVGEKYL